MVVCAEEISALYRWLNGETKFPWPTPCTWVGYRRLLFLFLFLAICFCSNNMSIVEFTGLVGSASHLLNTQYTMDPLIFSLILFP